MNVTDKNTKILSIPTKIDITIEENYKVFKITRKWGHHDET